MLADEELMQLVYRSNADAFEVIYDRHAGAAFPLTLRICSQRALAEDVVQEAFLSLWRSRARVPIVDHLERVRIAPIYELHELLVREHAQPLRRVAATT